MLWGAAVSRFGCLNRSCRAAVCTEIWRGLGSGSMALTVTLRVAGWRANLVVDSLCAVIVQAVRRVLVIDDDDLSREVLELLLSGEGYLVETASSGDEALGDLGDGQVMPDLVLMDLQMPGVSGEELARRLRGVCGASTTVLAMSGSRPAQADSEAFDGFLLKPFSMAQLGEARRRLGRASGGPRSVERTEVATAEEVLDLDTFRGFEAMVGKEPLRELYSLCLADASKQMAAMREAAVWGDDEEFRKSAHASKGSLGMVGAHELQGMCARLEERGVPDDHVASMNGFAEALTRLGNRLVALGVQLEGNIQE